VTSRKQQQQAGVKAKMSGLAGSNDKERLDNLVTKTHKEQAVFFLNAFWEVHRSPPHTQSYAVFAF
jgi:hypothetical protein